jgi:hypothetical protein
MAGCFGNSFWDRQQEQQLYRYLADCDDYEQLCEKMCANIPDDLWDKYDDYINKIIDKYLGVRVERGIVTMEEAQNLLLKMVQLIDMNKIYINR